jgi:hypothetical protein
MIGGELPTAANQWAKLAARKQPVWREGRPRDRFPWHGLATTVPQNPAPRYGKAKAEQDKQEHNGPSRAGTTGEPSGRQVHPASTDEQQPGRKRFQAHRQVGDGPLHHGRHRGRKASTTSPQSGHERSTSPAVPAAGDPPHPRQARLLHRTRRHHPHHPAPVLAHGRDERIQDPRGVLSE